MKKRTYIIVATALASLTLIATWQGGFLHWESSAELGGERIALGLSAILLLVGAWVLTWTRRLESQAETTRQKLVAECIERERSETELGTVLSSMNSLVAELDINGFILRFIPTRYELHELDPDDIEGRNIQEFLPNQGWKRFSQVLERVFLERVSEEVEQLVEIDNTQTPFQLTVSPLTEKSALMIGRDITERRFYEEELARRAFTDPLTSLPNRALFLDRLRRAMAGYQRREGLQYAVLYIDLDRFKIINESFGHAKGNAMIRATAQRIERCLRKVDTASRFLGDEFVLLLDEISDQREALRVVERVREVLSRPFIIEGAEVYTSASIGIAFSAPHYEDPDDIVRDAHAAMQWSRSRCRGGYKVFHSEIHDRAMSYLQLESDMRKAVIELSPKKSEEGCCLIEEGQNQFCLHYQPIVSLKTGLVTGVEALLRWQHPTRGMVSPVEFIPIAEETGLILPLGAWVLKQACTRLRELNRNRTNGNRLTMSVNISARQLQQQSLPGIIKDNLERNGVDGELLHLELTESMVMDNPLEANAALQELKRLGVSLAIDDFGTGYSSLSHLYKFPFDILKIDRSFVNRIEFLEGKHCRIIEAIVAMAQSMEMTVIAEGVEKEEQRARLLELGCTFAQGYHFARTLCTESLETYIRSCRPSLVTSELPTDASQ